METAAATLRPGALPPGSGWDRTVGVLKTVLPMGAGALLAVCVLMPLAARQDFSFILSKDRIESATERLRVDRASYRGQDAKGQAFAIEAREAVQKTSATPIVELRGITAELTTPEGPARAAANVGRYDLEREQVEVVGPIRVRAPNGQRLDTRDVVIDLPSRRITSTGPVDGAMPLGTFRAGRLTSDINARVVTLDKGAHLRITQRGAR